jgi:osmotically-inducible protein OsmY
MRLKNVSLVSFLAVALAVSAACSGSRQPAVQESAGMSNSEIQDKIRDRFDSDPELKESRILVDTDADQKRVTISGTVKSDDLHSKAVNVAQSAVPGITVVDRIQVQPPQELARTDEQAPAQPAAKHGKKRK